MMQLLADFEKSSLASRLRRGDSEFGKGLVSPYDAM